MGVETELQGALHAALTGNAAVMAIAKAVVDVGQQAADGGSATPFPFVTVGDITITPDDAVRLVNYQAVIRLHTFSRSGSMKEVKQLQGAMFDVLHRNESNLSLTGFNVYICVRESSQVLVEEDNTFHGVCEYRAHIDTTS